METTYNGWTNYETWAVALWLNNEQKTHIMLRAIARQKIEFEFEKDDNLRSYVEETYDFPTGGLEADLVGHALSRVNWREIIENAQED